jgi:hypothetical protein
MAITEEPRHQLYKALEESIGVQNATTLMGYLPPVGWADVATKRDLEMLDLRFETNLHRELRQAEGGLRHQMNVMFTLIVASNAAMASAIIAAVKLL